MRAIGVNVKLLGLDMYHPASMLTELPRGGLVQGAFRRSRASCATPAAHRRTPAASVDAVEVRVKTLGIVRTQRFDVVPSARLYCR